MRYFLAKRQEGPALFVADRIDTLHRALADDGLDGQFHPSYTRMVPAHHVVELALVGCPDPDPTYTRFFTPDARRAARRSRRDRPPLHRRARATRSRSGCGESTRRIAGRADRRLLLRRHRQRRGVSRHVPRDAAARPVAGAAQGVRAEPGRRARRRAGPRVPVCRSACRCSSRRSRRPGDLDRRPRRCACSRTTSRSTSSARRWACCCAAASARAIPDWRHLADGDGGDENLKDYPIEENPELTIRSVVDNLMLYQEGWGVGRIKHSLTYSGGLSRSYVRTYAPAAPLRLRRLQPVHAARRHRGRRRASRSRR